MAKDYKSPEWLMVDLGSVKEISRTEIDFEYTTVANQYRIETSIDGNKWDLYADHSRDMVIEAPKADIKKASARYIRVTIVNAVPSKVCPNPFTTENASLRQAFANNAQLYKFFGPCLRAPGIWEFRIH